MSRAATTRTVGDQITPCSRGLRSRRPRARWSRGSSKRSSSRRSRCCATSWNSRRRSDTSAGSHACAGPRSCRPARRSPPWMKGAAAGAGASLHELAEGDFLDDATNVLPSACPASARATRCAPSAALVDRGHAVLFMPTYSLVQELLAAAESGLAARLAQTRSLRGAGSSTMWATSSRVPRRLRFSSRSSPNATSDARSFITSNLIFAHWDRIFRDQMATAAAIDRLVHHSVLLEFDVSSFGPSTRNAGESHAKPSGGRLVTKRPRRMPQDRRSPLGRPAGRRGFRCWRHRARAARLESASGPVEGSRAVHGRRGRGRCRTRGRTERAHRSLENADGFPRAPTAIIGS